VRLVKQHDQPNAPYQNKEMKPHRKHGQVIETAHQEFDGGVGANAIDNIKNQSKIKC
jgi:hypothetical protein